MAYTEGEPAPDLHGLDHDQLVILGLAQQRAFELVRDNDGDMVAAAAANRKPNEALRQFDEGAFVAAHALWGITTDLFFDGDARTALAAQMAAQVEEVYE